MVIPVNQFGVQTCIVLPLTHVMVLEIPVHQLQYLLVTTMKMLLSHVVSIYTNKFQNLLNDLITRVYYYNFCIY